MQNLLHRDFLALHDRSVLALGRTLEDVRFIKFQIDTHSLTNKKNPKYLRITNAEQSQALFRKHILRMRTIIHPEIS